jgi:photosynthetic reaction center H subunit
MGTGAVTEYIDVAQLALYAFWLFFFGLVAYLHRENMREGYPLEVEVPGRIRNELLPPPPPKTFVLHDGTTVTVPRPDSRIPIHATPQDGWPGAPLVPTGDPMADGVGPAAYADREDKPELTVDGHPVIVPLRVETTFSLAPQDPDPRGMEVVGADGFAAGTVADVWVDRGEPQIRYLEVQLSQESGGRRVLLPIHYSRISSSRRRVTVVSILAGQFTGVPGTRSTDEITKLEEDRITAYYAGGTLYAEPGRQEPFL